MKHRILLSVLSVTGIVILFGTLGLATWFFTIPAASAQPGASCPANLTSYWKLDEAGAATTFEDTQGLRNATCSGANCPAATTGQVNGARLFNGVDSRVNISTSANYNWGNTDNFSIAVWMQGVAGQTCASSNEVLVGRYGPAAASRWWLGCADTSGNANFFLAGQNLQGSTAINDGAWHYVVAVRDGSNNRNLLYVDGQEVGNQSATYASGFGSNVDITLGWFNVNPFYHFEGSMDEVVFYNTALDQAAITRNFQYGAAGAGICTAAPQLQLSTTITPATVAPGLIRIHNGDAITITYSVTNTSGAPVKDVVVTDGAANLTVPDTKDPGDTDAWLEVGETWTFIRNVPATADGPLTGTPVVNATDPADAAVQATGDEYDLEIDVIVAPAISISAYTIDPATFYPGETLYYTVTVENNGTDPLKNVDVSSNTCASFTSTENGELAVDATRTFTCESTLNGDATSTIQATALDLLNQNVTPAQATAELNEIDPGISLTKTVDQTTILPGDTVAYSYLVENTGDDPLSNIVVSDPSTEDDPGCTDITYVSGDTNSNSTLEVNETWQFTCSIALEADTNSEATVTGYDSRNNPVTATATAAVDVKAPSITIEKTVNKPVILPGTSVEYTYVVANNGDYTLEAVSVSDEGCTPVTQQANGDGDAVLALEESWTYTCTTTLTADANSIATATGTALGSTFEATATAAVDVKAPSITVEKTVNKPVIAPGTSVEYTYVVANNGDYTLEAVSVSDEGCTPVTQQANGDGDAALAPEESWTYTCTTILTADANSIATATGTALGSTFEATATAAVDLVEIPDNALTISEQVTPSTAGEGEVVTYTYTVTNTDNDEPLTNVQVTDDKCSPVTGPQVRTGDDDTSLEPGEVWQYQCSTTYTTTAAQTAAQVVATDRSGRVQSARAPQVAVPAPEETETETLFLPLLIR